MTKATQKETTEIKLNKFEITRLLSSRAFELASGAKPKVKIDKKNNVLFTQDYVKIAQKEFEEGKLDLKIYK